MKDFNRIPFLKTIGSDFSFFLTLLGWFLIFVQFSVGRLLFSLTAFTNLSHWQVADIGKSFWAGLRLRTVEAAYLTALPMLMLHLPPKILPR